MSRQPRSLPLLRGRRRLLLAALLLAGSAAGCSDRQQAVTAPDAPARYTGTYHPTASPEVRATPSVVSPARTYRFWYQVRNTSPDVRSYWIWGYEGSGTLQIVGRTSDFSLQPGERRWVYVDMAVQTPATSPRDVELYFDVHDMQGDAFGYTRHVQPVRVSGTLPAVGFVAADYREVIHGQTHQAVHPGEIKTLRVRLTNPLGAQHTLCTSWLDDEGWTGQTTRPQPSARCVLVPAYGHTELNFAYRVPATAAAGTLDRQTLQVYSLADPNAVVYGYLRTTTSAGPTQQQFRKLYAWTFNAGQVGNPYGIPLQVKDAIPSGQDREYVGISFWQGTTWNYGGTYSRQHWVDFARQNPGRLYVVHDEPDQPQRLPDGSLYNPPAPPDLYAQAYRDVVAAIRDGDPTARFSPAGFAQRGQEATGPDGQTWLHGTDYAEAFLNAYRDRYKEDPPVEEWRFHALELGQTDWADEVRHDVAWSRQHGAPMVVGSFRGDNQEAAMQAIKDQAWLGADAGWIRSGVWYSYDNFSRGRTLVDAGYSPTSYGCRFILHASGTVYPGCPPA